jgi:serine/threonine-protein kinase
MSGTVQPGMEFAGYEIGERLGQGGMSVVYLAQDKRLGRRVALKVLSPELAEDERFRERFVRESRAAASIDHPNIIPIYEADEAEGVLYIAMRYVEARDLTSLIRREGQLDPERTLSLIEQVASALDAAHENGLIHRDVKPGNILIVPGGKWTRDHAYLADFGLTKVVSSGSSLTMSGQFVGTINYMAPEQIEGRDIDGTVDLYSLGCVLYECLTGAPPFDRPNDVAIMYAHLWESPPLVTHLRPDLPSEMDEVIATAMSKRKEGRFATCGAFASAARQAMQPGRKVVSSLGAKPDWQVSPDGRWVWNGGEWVLNGEYRLSDDESWVWDGRQWLRNPERQSISRPSQHGFATGYPPFWVLMASYLVDLLLLGIVTAIGYLALGSDATVFVALITSAVYFIGFWVYMGRTPGLVLFDLFLVDAATGRERLTVKQASIRYLALLAACLPLFIGLIWAAFDPRQQGWQDKLAKTLVIQRGARAEGTPPANPQP